MILQGFDQYQELGSKHLIVFSVSDVVESVGCPAVTDFMCHSGHCVESQLVCDNKADCADGSDEINCGVWK